MKNIETIDELTSKEGFKEALLISQHNFTQLFNAGYTAKWIYDTASFQILFANDAAIKQYGYSGEEFLNMTMMDISTKEDIPEIRLYNEFMKASSEPFSIVNFNQKRSREIILVETTYINIQYNGQAAILVSASDISGKIKLEKKISLFKIAHQQDITRAALNGQEKERDQIGKELNENINQLLATAKMYLGLSRSKGELKLNFIDQAENLLLKAIDEVRSLSNSLVPATMNLFGFKDTMQDLINGYLVTPTCQIELNMGEDFENTDQEMLITLFRVIQEYLDYIQKLTQAKNIQIGLSNSDRITLSIIDDGKSLDPTLNGSGIGMTNIINRVKLYNGSVKMSSKDQQGNTLMISIPTKTNAKGKKMSNILIVEDDPDDQEIIARAFAEVAPEFTVTCLNDGKMLVDYLQSFPEIELPALIVIDYNMPLMNGLETLRVLELDHRFNLIPKIIYSSSSQNYIRNLCYSTNAKAYITKGVSMDEIKENIQEMVSFVKSN
jgi:PAS domain S-box-containing protein